MISQRDKPSILVYYFDELNESDFKALLNGIEEEGVPYQTVPEKLNDIYKLSFDACVNSRLGVGLGVSDKEIALHYEKLEEKLPLFKINLVNNKNTVRAIGSNAARLVKRMPFKEL